MKRYCDIQAKLFFNVLWNVEIKYIAITTTTINSCFLHMQLQPNGA